MLGDRWCGLAPASRSVVYSSHGMVACVQPLAGAVALQVLQEGGNAVDAALAANAMLAVVEPSGCGVGGDLFAIVRTADGRFVGYNGSGRSPAAPVHHQGSQVPKLGAGSVTVPGCVDAWECLSRTHGTMPLARLLQPAIDAARAGTPVSEVIAACWTTDNFTASREIIGEPYYSAAMALFQRAPKAGQLWRNPDLARTLERVAQGGASAFYNEVLQPFGAFTRADFAAHVGTTQVVPVLSAKFRGATAHELPPNCSGLAVLIMVRVLDGFDLRAMNAADALHVQIEAKKLAYADASTFFGDGNDCAHLLDEEHIAALRARIRMDTVLPSVPEPPAARQKDTTCLSVADARSGVMISLIQSNFAGFGSGIVLPGTGFMLQNRGSGFVLSPGHPNAYAPSKRPYHTIIPAFVEWDDGTGAVVMAYGLMGGHMQAQGHAQVLQALLDCGMNPQQAGDRARWLHDSKSGVVAVESALAADDALCSSLRARGHVLEYLGADNGGTFGGFQAVGMKRWHHDKSVVFFGASDMRKDGCAMAFHLARQ